MFCVVQIIQRKKPDPYGAYKEYEVQHTTLYNSDGKVVKTHYSYVPNYDKGRFERFHRECYKISIHENRRENGKVVKKQCVIGTVGYYDLIQWGLYDYIDNGIQRAVDIFGVDYDSLYQLAADKMQPIIDKIEEEFRQSEEYQTEKHRQKLEKAHQKARRLFAEKYNIDANEYDYCYNIFGELMDEQYLQKIIQQYETQQETYRWYWKYQYDHYSSSSSNPHSANCYSDEQKKLLKEFYRTLSKAYHPDLNPNQDTTAAMQLINQLKEQWGI